MVVISFAVMYFWLLAFILFVAIMMLLVGCGIAMAYNFIVRQDEEEAVQEHVVTRVLHFVVRCLIIVSYFTILYILGHAGMIGFDALLP